MLPLVVDLDGTLIETDMLHESALKAFRNRIWDVVQFPLWLSQGKAALKRALAERSSFDASLLPYNAPFLAWLKQEKARGRSLVLCTASDELIAKPIAVYLDIFDEVMASNGSINLAGINKAEALEARFGKKGFDYAGNSRADLAIWARAHGAIVVNASKALEHQARELCVVERIFAPTPFDASTFRHVLRVHQWLKNILLFVPLLAAHQLTNVEAWFSLLLAFISFSLCASSVYVANDLLDLESDRQHPRKRNRPFASGRVPVLAGVLIIPALLIPSILIGMLVGGNFLFWLTIYFAITCAYSFGLKQVMLVDCITLAMLYTLRIVSGAAAISNTLSLWLLAFSVFLFLSLAFVKRYAELEVQLLSGKEKVHGRGYFTSDAPLIQSLGVASGYASVLVLALYLNSEVVIKLYKSPGIVWGAIPVMLFWISQMWMQAHRGKMHDDPVVFAVKDRASLVAGVLFVFIILCGAAGWPW